MQYAETNMLLLRSLVEDIHGKARQYKEEGDFKPVYMINKRRFWMLKESS
jgi:hypothetical protein